MVQTFGMGQGFLVLMDRTNRFFSAGVNEKGQLGINNENEVEGWFEIEALAEREVKMICCGAKHVKFDSLDHDFV